MSTLEARARVGIDGKLWVVVPEDVAGAGAEVVVTVRPAMAAVDEAKYRRVIEETAGSIPELVRLHPGHIDPLPSFD